MRTKQTIQGTLCRRIQAFFWVTTLLWLASWSAVNSASAALVFPEQAIQIRSTGAVLAATITLTAGPGKAWFEYGLGTNLNLRSAEVTLPVATNLMRLRIPIGGLQAGNLVRYQGVFSNGSDIVRSRVSGFVSEGRPSFWPTSGSSISIGNEPASRTVQIAASFMRTHLVQSDGSVVSWGSDFFGGVAMPVGATGVSMIAAGPATTVGLLNDGRIRV